MKVSCLGTFGLSALLDRQIVDVIGWLASRK